MPKNVPFCVYLILCSSVCISNVVIWYDVVCALVYTCVLCVYVYVCA